MQTLSKQTKIIAAVVLLIGILAGFMTVQTIKTKDEPKAPVSATVTAMEEYDNSTADDTDRGYDVYVDYEYDGKTYEHIHYKQVGFSTKISVGDKVDLEVYVRNPGSIVQDAKGFAIYLWILFALGVVFTGFKVKNDVKVAKAKEQRD